MTTRQRKWGIEMRIAFDMTLKRPGCAILQAVYNGTPGIANFFPPESWLTTPTDNMTLYEFPDEQLSEVIRLVETELKRVQ